MTSKSVLTAAARVLSPELFARLHCFAKLGYLPRLVAPRTFTERLLAKRVWDHNPLIAFTADKYTLRTYVEQRVGREYLPKLYLVVEKAADVDVLGLPRAYVMKGSHGSGWNRIVDDSQLTTEAARALAAVWLRSSYYWKRQEWAYRDLTPRVIFEENLAPGEQIDDYKVFTFGGVPRLVQVDHDRFSGHTRSFFSTSWEPLNVRCDYPQLPGDKGAPRRLSDMLEVAAELGAPFSFCRVDLYSVEDRIVVGEITHYPDSGVVRFEPESFDAELGAVWEDQRPLDRAYLAP